MKEDSAIGIAAVFGVLVLLISALGEFGVYGFLYRVGVWFISLPWYDKGYLFGMLILLFSVATPNILRHVGVDLDE